jgi:MoaA/NifB/PqqE/SkfB family radical SAM enzyme
LNEMFKRLKSKILRASKLVKYYSVDSSHIRLTRDSVLLEACSMCQLRCPICPTGTGLNKAGIIGWGYLKFENFKKFVDLNPNIKNIELSNYGEIFLNPDLKKIIEYAYSKKIRLTAANGVNLNTVSEDVLESLVKYNLRFMTVSIDGATNDTYKIYRIGGNLEKVIENVKIINRFKKKYNSKFPKLAWQFVIMGHNEHELPAAKKLAEGLDMIFAPKLNWDPSFSPVRDKNFVRKETGLDVASIDEFKQKHGRDYSLACRQFWTSPQINWDGKLLGCCVNIWSDFGNVFEEGLDNCLKSEKYIYVKKTFLGEKRIRDDIPCARCNHYSSTLKTPLKKKDII